MNESTIGRGPAACRVPDHKGTDSAAIHTYAEWPAVDIDTKLTANLVSMFPRALPTRLSENAADDEAREEFLRGYARRMAIVSPVVTLSRRSNIAD